MPNNYKKFSDLEKINYLNINIDGWINPLIIEYGIGLYNNVIESYFWRIQGTKHTFIIPIKQLNFLSKGNYEEHFKMFLKEFRDKYKMWEQEYNFEAEWMQDYYRQFHKFIK